MSSDYLTMTELFDFIEDLNKAAPLQLRFAIDFNSNLKYSTKKIAIFLHGQMIGTLRVSCGWKKSMAFDVNLGEDWNSKIIQENFGWVIRTQGIIPKCINLVEDMINGSREILVQDHNNNEWSDITQLDFDHLTKNSLGEGGRNHILYDKSSISLRIGIPIGAERHKFPREYVFSLNGDRILKGEAILINDPRIVALIHKCDAFERQVRKVLGDD